MRRFFFTAVAGALVALSASQAQAEDVLLSGFTFNPASSLSVTAPDYTGQAGQYTGTLNGNSFVTYCTDIVQAVSFGVQLNYTKVDGATVWGATKSADVDRALSYFNAHSYPSDPSTSATAQAVIWEILNEAPGNSYSLSSGSFKATSPYAVTQAALDSFDFAAMAAQPITVHADQLFNATYQDLLTINIVPEPSVYALMLAGVASIGFIARRRRAQR